MPKQTSEAAPAIVPVVELTSIELTEQIENADIAADGLQSQITDLEQQMSTHESTWQAIARAANARSTSMGFLQIRIAAAQKDMQRLRASQAITAGTRSQVATDRGIQELITQQQELAGSLDAEVMDDEKERVAETSTIADSEKAHADIEVQLDELRAQQAALASERAKLAQQLLQVQCEEDTTDILALQDAVQRGEAALLQDRHQAAAKLAALSRRVQGHPELQSETANTLREAVKSLRLNELHEDSMSALVRTQIAFLDALEASSPIMLAALIDQRPLSFWLALDQSALTGLSSTKNAFDRSQNFALRRDSLLRLAEKYHGNNR